MKYTKTLLAIAAMSALTISCSDEDYFNKAEYDKLIASTFPVDDVDPDHDWQTIGSADVKITLMQSGEGQSTIRIYDGEPSVSGTTMLAKASLSNGETMNTSINYPLSNPNVVISLTDPEGYRGYYYRTIENGELTTTVGDAQTETKATRAGVGAATRAETTYITFMDDYNGGVYPTEIPSGATEFTGSSSKNGVYYVNNDNVSPLTFSEGSTIYVAAGTYSLKIGTLAKNSTLVLLKGANVTTTNSDFKSEDISGNIIICEGASLTGPNNKQIRLMSMSIYSKGSITQNNAGKDFKLMNGTRLYNNGSLNTLGDVNVEDSSQFVNAGALSLTATMTIQGSFWNIGSTSCTSCDLVFTDASHVFNNEGTFNASDQFTYGQKEDEEGSYEVQVGKALNSCKLTATNKIYFHLKNAIFENNAGASMVTADLESNLTTTIKMGSNSMIDATTFEPKYSTIDGIGDGFALIKTGRFDGDSKDVSLQGKIYVDVKNDNWKDFQNVSKGNSVLKFEPGNAKLDITTSECSAGYSGKPDETTAPETAQTLRYCYEDNFPMAGDYDFNDVVLDITPNKENSTTIKYSLSLQAVGASNQNAAALHLAGVPSSAISSVDVSPEEANDLGEYNTSTDRIQTAFDNKMLISSEQGDEAVIYLFNDAHYMFTKSTGSNGSIDRVYINTVRSDDPKIKTGILTGADPVQWEITVTFNNETYVNKALQEAYLDPFIVTEYNGAKWEVHTSKWQGQGMIFNHANASDYDINRPWAICVPSSFKYPKEFIAIGTYSNGTLGGAYKTEGNSFGEWSRNRYTATEWYNYPESDQVYE